MLWRCTCTASRAITKLFGGAPACAGIGRTREQTHSFRVVREQLPFIRYQQRMLKAHSARRRQDAISLMHGGPKVGEESMARGSRETHAYESPNRSALGSAKEIIPHSHCQPAVTREAEHWLRAVERE